MLLLGRIADLFLDDFGILAASPQLVADLGRDAALRLVGLDVFDHLELALAVSDEELAGLVRRCMVYAGGLDHRAVLFGFLTQWQEFVRAVLTAREARAAEHGGWGCTIDERRRRIVDS